MTNNISWSPISDETKELRKRLFGPNSNQHEDVVSDPFGIVSRPKMAEVIKEIGNIVVRTDDIWIVTYPKCGTTLTQVSRFDFLNNH